MHALPMQYFCLITALVGFSNVIMKYLHSVLELSPCRSIRFVGTIWYHYFFKVVLNWAINCLFFLACVAVVSVSLSQAGQARKTREGIGQKGAKKVGEGGRSGEGKETPAAEPRHFTERPQMASLP